MKKNQIFTILLVVFLLFLSSSTFTTLAEEKAVIYKSLKLYGISEESGWYHLYYPLDIKQPGQIKIRVDTIQQKNNNHRGKVYVRILSAKVNNATEWKKWISDPDNYHPELDIKDVLKKRFVKNNKLTISYVIDSYKLHNYNVKYIIDFVNKSKGIVPGTFKITYPGSKWDIDLDVLKYNNKNCPDLLIKDISLTKNKKLKVTVANQGQGLYTGFYHLKKKDTVVLQANVNGTKYVVPLPIFDPNRQLRIKNQEIIYVFNKIKINKESNVNLSIDKNGKVKENNINNNIKSVVLHP